eukprot:GHVU01115177.1.p4 GENE.GHVU01115177.1~~GHVU01115177.1.p4  ORF type:complete len:112 (+),score=17.12 GHVU01115177.1:1216-1551(+)
MMINIPSKRKAEPTARTAMIVMESLWVAGTADWLAVLDDCEDDTYEGEIGNRVECKTVVGALVETRLSVVGEDEVVDEGVLDGIRRDTDADTVVKGGKVVRGIVEKTAGKR